MLKRIVNRLTNRSEARKIRREARLIHSDLILSGQALRMKDKEPDVNYAIREVAIRPMGMKWWRL